MQFEEWKDEYNVGCDYVDNAHRKLFSVLHKLEELLSANSYEKDRYACLESIKFLKNYTLTHFAEEEGFMKQIGYKGYDIHKQLHDELRDNTLPALEEELIASDFSKEAIENFAGVFAGWLTGHIIIEDRAITGRAISKWHRLTAAPLNNDDCINLLDGELSKFMREIFRLNCTLRTKSYDGVAFDKAFYYEMTFNDSYKVVMIASQAVIFAMVSQMLGVTKTLFDKSVLLTYVQLAGQMAKTVLNICDIYDNIKLTSQRAISEEELVKMARDSDKKISLAWGCEKGSLGLYVQL